MVIRPEVEGSCEAGCSSEISKVGSSGSIVSASTSTSCSAPFTDELQASGKVAVIVTDKVSAEGTKVVGSAEQQSGLT